jgi:hypothetical protein
MGLKQLLIDGGKKEIHTATVNGQELTFHPVRVAAMLQAQSVVATIARAVMGFFDPNKDQYTKRSVLNENDPETGVICTSSVEEPISPVHAEKRLNRREASVEKAITALLSDDNAQKLAVLVCDSLRDGDLTPEDVMEFDAPLFVALIKETVTANAPTLRPFLMKAMERMQNALSPADEQAEQPDESSE